MRIRSRRGAFKRDHRARSRPRLERANQDDRAARVIDQLVYARRLVGFGLLHLRGFDEQEINVVGLSHPVAFALDEPVAFRVPLPAPGAFNSIAVEPRLAWIASASTARNRGTSRPSFACSASKSASLQRAGGLFAK